MDEDIRDSFADGEKKMAVNVAKRYSGLSDRKINALIRAFVAQIAMCNRKYIEVCTTEWGHRHYHFLYKEREIYSLMSAAMHQITPVHQSESRVTRKRDRRNPINRGRDREGRGRVDLWAYKDGIEYFFEFKRSYVSLNSVADGKIPNQVMNPWTQLDQQVKQVKDGLKDWEKICCIGLQVITPYRSRRGSEPFSPEQLPRRRIGKDIASWTERFHPNPDAILWYIDEEEMSLIPTMWDAEDENVERWEFHPYHLFLFRILST